MAHCHQQRKLCGGLCDEDCKVQHGYILILVVFEGAILYEKDLRFGVNTDRCHGLFSLLRN